jgi:hypothetical protein
VSDGVCRPENEAACVETDFADNGCQVHRTNQSTFRAAGPLGVLSLNSTPGRRNTDVKCGPCSE